MSVTQGVGICKAMCAAEGKRLEHDLFDAPWMLFLAFS
jgi:hypothetical protein